MNVFDYYASYFLSTDDKAANFFEIDQSPNTSPFLNGIHVFDSGKEKINIIDQFSGKIPYLFNYDFCVSRQNLNLEYVPIIILDSHIVNNLHRYIATPDKMRPATIEMFKEFVIFVTTKGFDYSPVFYLTESYAKSTYENYMKYVPEVLHTLLRLHSMDDNWFLETGKIEPNNKAIDHYLNKYNCRSIKECAEEWAKEFAEGHDVHLYINELNFSYAVLLKMVLINHASKKPLLDKLDELYNFMTDVIGVVLAREKLLSICYFLGIASKLVNAQANMSHKKAKHNLMSTAWDLLLLRLPEYLLNVNYYPELTIGYVCTSEKHLAKVGKWYTIEKLAYRSDDGQIKPGISFNFDVIEKQFGNDVVSKIKEYISDAHSNRMLNEKRKALNEYELRCLIEDLEVQLSYFCRG